MMKVKFGDVVNRVNIKVDRHHTDRIYYVGGEHIESNELMIHDKGLIKGSTIGYKFHFGFNPRHVLFMSRNPHLRKCSMVNFSGVCSDSTYVVETKDDSVLLQDYLLFEMQSDRFWKWAEEHKSGGVNYLINYATLSSYEFFLPSLSVQRDLSKKLWAAYRLKESYKKLLMATRDMVKSQFIEMFGNPVTNNKGWHTLPIKEVAPEDPSSEKQTGKVWILNLDMIESNTGKIIGKVFEDDSNLLSVAPFDEGNVLYSKLRPYLNKVVVPDEKGYATTELVPLRPNQKLLNLTFFSHLLRGDDFVTYANSISTGTKMPRMPLNDLRKFPCILPPMEKQIEFENIAQQADKSEFDGLKMEYELELLIEGNKFSDKEFD